INRSTTPQTDAWQYRQQGQYQDAQAEQHAAEQGKNEHSGSLKDTAQAEVADNPQSFAVPEYLRQPEIVLGCLFLYKL
ncbi:MAG: hypothetical protein II131_00585, partial [Neisseriaceae bacterium]|nr:hypothetical protein [Neisseriaceae bacterium]